MGTVCSPEADDVFGPTVQASCRQGFDFTLLFEQIVLSSIPSMLIIGASILQAAVSTKKSTKTSRKWSGGVLKFTKQVKISQMLPS